MRSLTIRLLIATVASVALADALWVVTRLFAPYLIVPIYRVVGGSNPTLISLSVIGPMLVALPFGVAYGLAGGRAPLLKAAAIAVGAAALVTAFAAFAGSVSGRVWWVVPLEAVAFMAEFVCVVLLTHHFSLRMPEQPKFAIGTIAYVVLAVVAAAAPSVYFCAVLKVCDGAA